MKKYDSIMERVRFIEHKYGISYAKPDGKLFGTLKILYLLAAIYTLGINLLYIAGMLLIYSGTENFSTLMPQLITVSVCTAAMVAGYVLLCTRLKIIGAAVSIASLPFMLLTFARLLKDDLGFLGFKLSFYWRHFAPVVLMLIFLISMLIIAIRAGYKTNKQYKKIVSNLYEMYSVSISGDGSAITDEQWDKFLESYDPRDYRKQFAKQTEEIKETEESAKAALEETE